MVDAAELVCSVPKVRWPVSAMRSATRSSPGRAFRRSARRRVLAQGGAQRVGERMGVRVDLALVDQQFLFWCMNSMGSSIVIMCSCRSLLILSSMAASVVDLPLPVGPVTRINPRGRSHSLATTCGRLSWSNDLMSNGMMRKTAETAPRW